MSKTLKDEKFADPNYLGPGIWWTLHTISFMNLHDDLFLKIFKNTIDNLPCKKCRQHANEWYKNNNFDIYKASENYSQRIYTFNFHNEVNRRLGKEQMSYVEYDNVYSGNYDPDCGDCTIKEEEKSEDACEFISFYNQNNY